MEFSHIKIETYLRNNGIKPSYQRIKVLEYLVEHKNHPTVDTIYRELVEEIPTLSKTTIYNTLKLFLEKKIVQPISIEENETRYDADISIHGHFKCEECGNVYDFRVDLSQMKVEGLEQFLVNDKQVFYKGICQRCLKI